MAPKALILVVLTVMGLSMLGCFIFEVPVPYHHYHHYYDHDHR